MMDSMEDKKLMLLMEQAMAGDRNALEAVILSVQDLVFNLSLRMLGTFQDAEDASQDILLKVITHLPSFKRESSFSTWVFSIAVNHLKNYQKHMFAKMPLSFEFYGDDIVNGKANDLPDSAQEVEKSILAEELKMSCTNVMLQCLDVESRCIFILGTMFKVDSQMAGELLGISAEAYRQRLSRIRRKMADFLREYCGEYGSGACRCINRVNYAIQHHRISPDHLDYTAAASISPQTIREVKEAMESINDLSEEFSFCKAYQSPEALKQFIRRFLDGTALAVIQNAQEEVD